MTALGVSDNIRGSRAVVTVAFDLAGRQGDYAIDVREVRPDVGDRVVVESGRGLAMGRVVKAPHVPGPGGGGRIRKVVRVATERDLDRQQDLERREPEYFRLALREVRGSGLPLKLLRVVPDALAEKLTVYLAGPDREEIADLARAIGRAVSLRVDLRQLGLRDVTRALGGLGRCGRELCCSTFLAEYPKTSVRQAKEQGMALAQERTAGVCGKTLCCLAYENDLYRERRRWLPKPGKRARTLDGQEGKVIGVDVMRGTFTLLDAERRRAVFQAEDWDQNAGKEVPPPEFETRPKQVVEIETAELDLVTGGPWRALPPVDAEPDPAEPPSASGPPASPDAPAPAEEAEGRKRSRRRRGRRGAGRKSGDKG